MKIEITENDVTYNYDGTPDGHRTADKGDVVEVPTPVGKTLIDIGQAKRYEKPKPQNKVVKPNNAKSSGLKAVDRGAGWYDVFDSEGNEVEGNIRGRKNLKEKYPNAEVVDE